MTLQQKFAFFIKKENLFQQKDKLLIAVSGGADSSVLCALCDEAGFDFAIAHCNFKLRGEESERDELFVKKMSEHYKVTLFSTSFNTSAIAKAHRKSIEETARNHKRAHCPGACNGLPVRYPVARQTVPHHRRVHQSAGIKGGRP